MLGTILYLSGFIFKSLFTIGVAIIKILAKAGFAIIGFFAKKTYEGIKTIQDISVGRKSSASREICPDEYISELNDECVNEIPLNTYTRRTART